jgi:site-specific recombinase XerD
VVPILPGNDSIIFATHVLPLIGKQRLDEIGLATLQLLVNQMAEDGYSKSTVRKVRMYVKASFDYAADEDLVAKNPARKLAMPKIRKTVCRRFLSMEEIGALLSEAEPREHLVLHILASVAFGRPRSWCSAWRTSRGTSSELTRL